MKAVLQNFKTGDLAVEDVPPPLLKPHGVLVRNAASLVSAGTEKAVIELARMNPLQKARARPDLVRKVLEKAGQEGLLGTAKIVMNLVSAPLPLGYSCAGIVDTVGAAVTDIRPGMRVACAGIGFANHAEIVYVPRNLLVPIPDGVEFAEASFVTLGAIAMQGVRQAELALGEAVVVIGLGLVGQITAQLCAASGCSVFGIDADPSKIELARSLGIDGGASLDEDVSGLVKTFTGGRGADAVIITASTKSSQPVGLAAELARDRARIVAVGDVGHEIPRRAYFEKELELRQSRSYGPGRYDPAYEERGVDYPIGYVRWTENRNMEAFLSLVAKGDVRLTPLLTHRYGIEQAEHAYAHLTGDAKPSEPYIGILLEYDPEKQQPTVVDVEPGRREARTKSGELSFGVIGAGQFAQGILLPLLQGQEDVRIASIATGSGLTAKNVARKYRALRCTSDYATILNDESIDAVLVATRHDTHARIVAEALRAGKHVFVEKPLALSEAELAEVIEAYNGSLGGQLLVGFNRRFSPLFERLRVALQGSPLNMHFRVNAGAVDASHWAQDSESGGGRVLGEVCHFVDTLVALCGAPPVEVGAQAVVRPGEALPADPDNINITLRFADGSIGNILYTSAGSSSFPKERLEVFGGEKVGVIDNWRSLRLSGKGTNASKRSWVQTAKGHAEEMEVFVSSIRGGEPAIAFETLLAVSRTTFAIQRALRSGMAEFVENQ